MILNTKIATVLFIVFIQSIATIALAQTIEVKDKSFNFKGQLGLYRYKLGDFEITALSDGTVAQDLHTLLTTGAPLAIASRIEFGMLSTRLGLITTDAER